jgi:hypothetical protein
MILMIGDTTATDSAARLHYGKIRAPGPTADSANQVTSEASRHVVTINTIIFRNPVDEP